MNYCVQKSNSLELMNIKIFKKIDNLHFLPNNIFTRLFKELIYIYIYIFMWVLVPPLSSVCSLWGVKPSRICHEGVGCLMLG